jgi:hypothetical protein
MKKERLNEKDIGRVFTCLLLFIAVVLLIGCCVERVRGADDPKPVEFKSDDASTWIAQKTLTSEQINLIIPQLSSEKLNGLGDNGRNKLYESLYRDSSFEQFNKVIDKLESKYILELWNKIPETVLKDGKTKGNQKNAWDGLSDPNKVKLWSSFNLDKQNSEKLKTELLSKLDNSGRENLFNKLLNDPNNKELFNDPNNKELFNDKNLVGSFLLKDMLRSIKNKEGKQVYSEDVLKTILFKGLDNKDIQLKDGQIGIFKDSKLVAGFNVGLINSDGKTWKNEPQHSLRGVEYKENNFIEIYDSQLTKDVAQMRTVVHNSGVVDKDGVYNGFNVLYGKGGTVTILTKDGVDSYSFSGSGQPAIMDNTNKIIYSRGALSVKDGKLVEVKGSSEVWFNLKYDTQAKPLEASSYDYVKLKDSTVSIIYNSNVNLNNFKGVLLDVKDGIVTGILIKGVNGIQVLGGGDVSKLGNLNVISDGSNGVTIVRFSNGKIQVVAKGNLIQYPFQGGIIGYISPDLKPVESTVGSTVGSGAQIANNGKQQQGMTEGVPIKSKDYTNGGKSMSSGAQRVSAQLTFDSSKVKSLKIGSDNVLVNYFKDKDGVTRAFDQKGNLYGPKSDPTRPPTQCGLKGCPPKN